MSMYTSVYPGNKQFVHGIPSIDIGRTSAAEVYTLDDVMSSL